MKAAIESPPAEAITTAIAEYSPVAAALADLSHRFRSVVFDVTTAKGNQEARAARFELVKLRTGLESKRRELKAPALERSRLIDSEAGRINAFIAELEIPIDQAIKLEETRKEAERQAKADAEQRRVTSLLGRVDAIRLTLMSVAGATAAEIEGTFEALVALKIDETFAEFEAAAHAAKAETLAKLRELHTSALAREAEAARIKAERAELDRLRAEQAKRDTEEAATRRAEQMRVAAEQKVERDRLGAERRMLEEQQAAARTEQKRLEDEARAQREEADRRARAERDEQDRIARAERAGEQKRLDDAAAELRQEQAKTQAKAAAEQRRQIEQEQAAAAEQQRQEAARLEAEWQARTRMQAAAPAMLDALLLWRSVDQAKASRNTDAWKQAAAAREAAIAAATVEGNHDS